MLLFLFVLLYNVSIIYPQKKIDSNFFLKVNELYLFEIIIIKTTQADIRCMAGLKDSSKKIL